MSAVYHYHVSYMTETKNGSQKYCDATVESWEKKVSDEGKREIRKLLLNENSGAERLIILRIERLATHAAKTDKRDGSIGLYCPDDKDISLLKSESIIPHPWVDNIHCVFELNNTHHKEYGNCLNKARKMLKKAMKAMDTVGTLDKNEYLSKAAREIFLYVQMMVWKDRVWAEAYLEYMKEHFDE